MPLRDLALTALLLAAMPVSIARPFIGAMFFAWLSLMYPHRLTFSFAYNFGWAQWIALATLIGFVASKEREFADSVVRYRYALIYFGWTVITTLVAFRFDASVAKLDEFFKVQLMCLVTLSLLLSRKRVEIFLLVAIGSVAFYGVKGGVFTLLTDGNYRVWGPKGTVLGDNNQLGTALTMTVPMLYWAAHWAKPIWLRLGLYAAMALTAIAVFGTHSRGSFLAAAAMGIFLALKSHRKLATITIVVGLGAVAVLFMPQEYWDRIQSISDYEEDGSAQGRIRMWMAAVSVAGDRITGGGFDMYRSAQFLSYVGFNPRSPHSIYFQALGEHGWIGLSLMLLFWGSIWFQCRRAIIDLRGIPETENLMLMMRMIQVSLVGYAVGGMFVNIGYWDYPFYLAIAVLAVRRLLANGALAPVDTSTTVAAAAASRPSAQIPDRRLTVDRPHRI